MAGRFIEVVGARRGVTAVTGVAGAGKSSLALDVLYAEGHRRYAETFSPDARRFLEGSTGRGPSRTPRPHGHSTSRA